MKEIEMKHESYGMIEINKFTGNNNQFFGSDLIHNNGISIVIKKARKVRKLNSEWFHYDDELIRIELSNNQFVDAITSGMNTSGVPCTIKRFAGAEIEQIDHIEDKKSQFKIDMKDTQIEYSNRIDEIMEILNNGKSGKKKTDEIKHELEILKSHISSNTPFVLTCFNEAMEKTVTEAKHSVSNYIDNKVHSLGIEGLKNKLNEISIGEK